MNALIGGQLFSGYLGEMRVSLEGMSLGYSRELLCLGPAPLIINQLPGQGLKDTHLHRSGSVNTP